MAKTKVGRVKEPPKPTPGLRWAVNQIPNMFHYWDGKTFAESGRPVAECHPEIELYPRASTTSGKHPRSKRNNTCSVCYKKHSTK
jgi:hypothetical protein